VEAHIEFLDAANAAGLLTGSDVVVDCLDSLKFRFILEEACKTAGIPLVSAAIAGVAGHVTTIFPEDPGLKQIYGDVAVGEDGFRSPEAILGVPCLTPSFIATLQAMEVLKIILKRGKILRNTMAYVDLEEGELNLLSFQKGDP